MFYCIAFVAVSIVFRIVLILKFRAGSILPPIKPTAGHLLSAGNHLSMIDPVFVVMAYGVGQKNVHYGQGGAFQSTCFKNIVKVGRLFPC